MDFRRPRLFALLLACALLMSPSAAFAAMSGRIVENVGVKTARLNYHDSTDDHRIGRPWKRVRDTNYPGQTVWQYRFGAKSKSTGHYPIEMYSKGNHHVFAFIIYSGKFETKNHTHTGTSEATLAARYGSRVSKWTGSRYTEYRMGTHNGMTTFCVKSGKVHHIVIERY